MLEKETPPSNEADNAFHSANSKSLSLASNGIKTSFSSTMDTLSTGGELSGNESIQSEKTFAVSDSVGYQPQFPEAGNDLSFFENSGRKDSNDSLGYSWDDLGNFEDVDRMFRSCDSTFVLGNSQEDDLGWLSSSDAIGESGDVLKSDIKLAWVDSSSWKSMSESEDISRSNDMTYSVDDSEMQNSSTLFKGSDQLGVISFSNGISYSGGMDSKDKVSHKEHVNAVSLGVEPRNVGQQKMSDADFATNYNIDESIKQMELSKQSENNKIDQHVGNGSFFYAADCPEAAPQPIEALDSHTFGYLHSETSFVTSDYCLPSDQRSLHPAQSVIKSENSHLTSVSTKDSYSLNHMQAVMDSGASPLQVISFAAGDKGEWINQPKNFQASSSDILENEEFGAQTSMPDIISTEKPIHYSGKIHGNGVIEGVQQESGSSVSQNCSRNSALGDISIEATSFRQLQLVMEQLDVRTKLCIRDSLYRLARSAEQRHHYDKLTGAPIVDRDSMLTEGSSKFPAFVDMETDTNPIDRSIAHLLFHRPADHKY